MPGKKYDNLMRQYAIHIFKECREEASKENLELLLGKHFASLVGGNFFYFLVNNLELVEKLSYSKAATLLTEIQMVSDQQILILVEKMVEILGENLIIEGLKVNFTPSIKDDPKLSRNFIEQIIDCLSSEENLVGDKKVLDKLLLKQLVDVVEEVKSLAHEIKNIF